MRASRFLRTGGKTVVFGGEARERMLYGIERIAKAVAVTLGPKGRNVIIRQPDGEPKITKDGVTVARSIEFRDQFEDIGAKLIRQVAGKTNDVAGDGTTTATILAWSIFAEGYKCVATGANPMDLKRGIDLAVAELTEGLNAQKRAVADQQTLENVATISANSDRPLGTLIASAVQAVGADGFIEVLDGSCVKTSWVRHEGWSTESGFVDSSLVTDGEHLCSEVTNALTFVTTDPLECVEDFLVLLEVAATLKRPLAVVSPAVSEAVIKAAVLNHQHGAAKIVLCAMPKATEEDFQDCAIACSSSIVKVETLRRVSDVVVLLGSAEKVTQTMDSTVLLGTGDVTARVRLLQERIGRAFSEDQREVLRARMAKLNKSFAVIRVGGRSVVEIGESKDRVVDALNAARNALADGIVGGGGSALVHASKRLDTILMENEDLEQDRRMGIMIVRNAAKLPARLIGDNAGVEGAVVVGNLEEYEDTVMGYDAQNDRYVNMFDAGIIDPIKVVRSCLNDAASVAGLMITTEASVCDFE